MQSSTNCTNNNSNSNMFFQNTSFNNTPSFTTNCIDSDQPNFTTTSLLTPSIIDPTLTVPYLPSFNLLQPTLVPTTAGMMVMDASLIQRMQLEMMLTQTTLAASQMNLFNLQQPTFNNFGLLNNNVLTFNDYLAPFTTPLTAPTTTPIMPSPLSLSPEPLMSLGALEESSLCDLLGASPVPVACAFNASPSFSTTTSDMDEDILAMLSSMSSPVAHSPQSTTSSESDQLQLPLETEFPFFLPLPQTSSSSSSTSSLSPLLYDELINCRLSPSSYSSSNSTSASTTSSSPSVSVSASSKHMHVIRNRKSEYKCGSCPLVFETATQAKNHRKSHKRRLRVSCLYSREDGHICGKKFCTNQELKRHISSHTKEKEYPCPNGCGIWFSRQDASRRHARD
ncbi:hypothetical protein HDU97_007414, partial [Phlyctochytrium planicorne]